MTKLGQLVGEMIASNGKYNKLEIKRDLGQKYEPKIEYIENMLVLIELRPVFSIGNECSLGTDLLDNRRALSYEIQYKICKLLKALMLEINESNEIASAIIMRSIIELKYFVFYFVRKHLNDNGFIENILMGSQFSKFEQDQMKNDWLKEKNESMPDDALQFLKSILKNPHISEYKSYYQENSSIPYDPEYEYLCEYAHPSFGNIRGRNSVIYANSDDVIIPAISGDYYKSEYDNPHREQIEILIDSCARNIQEIYEYFRQIDPIYSKAEKHKMLDYLGKKDRTSQEETIMIICMNIK